MLARSAASLDLLSGGRFELALGAGAFWDAIEAMGGPRRAPGDAVTALEEGTQIIRALWDTGTSGAVHLDGRHYRIRGAERGPRPVHDIGIWPVAYGPRMLRLTGRAAPPGSAVRRTATSPVCSPSSFSSAALEIASRLRTRCLTWERRSGLASANDESKPEREVAAYDAP
jgi:hypothetical protein